MINVRFTIRGRVRVAIDSRIGFYSSTKVAITCYNSVTLLWKDRVIFSWHTTQKYS